MTSCFTSTSDKILSPFWIFTTTMVIFAIVVCLPIRPELQYLQYLGLFFILAVPLAIGVIRCLDQAQSVKLRKSIRTEITGERIYHTYFVICAATLLYLYFTSRDHEAFPKIGGLMVAIGLILMSRQQIATEISRQEARRSKDDIPSTKTSVASSFFAGLFYSLVGTIIWTFAGSIFENRPQPSSIETNSDAIATYYMICKRADILGHELQNYDWNLRSPYESLPVSKH